jgi:hypothetical protein
MGLASVGAHKLGGMIRVGSIFQASHKIGQHRGRAGAKANAKFSVGSPLPILQARDDKHAE